MEKVSLIVPCYNEENNVKDFYDATIEAFKETKYEVEIIFVDDGSSDQTMGRLKETADNASCFVKIISFSRNFGKEAAIFAGLKNVTGDCAVVIDADMQQPPALILPMLKELEKDPQCDTVVYYQDVRKESVFMRVTKKIYYDLINKISSVEFKVGASDFRLFRRNVINAVLEMTENVRFSKGIFSWVGFNKKYLPYTPEKRQSGKSKWGFFKLMRYGISGLTSFSSVPLKISSYFGGIISVFAFIYLFIVLIQKLVYGIGIPGYPTLACLILLLGGVQLLSLGIIGEYISKTFLETKNRPLYIERSVYSNTKGEKDD